MFDYTVLDRAIEKFGNEEKSLIAILQAAQEHYRYLPKEIFPYLSEKLGVSEAKIFGVVTFYENFSLEKKHCKKVSALVYDTKNKAVKSL